MRHLSESDKSFYMQKHLGNPADYTPKHLRILRRHLRDALDGPNLDGSEDWFDNACESAVYNADLEANETP